MTVRGGSAAAGLARWGVAAALVAACAPSTGRFEHRYPTGELRMEVPTVNGKYDGTAVTYRRDGSAEWQGQYVAGKRHGVFVFITAQNTLARREVYVRDRLVWTSPSPDADVPDSIMALVEEAPPDEGPAVLLETSHLEAAPAFGLADPLQGETGADVRFDLVMPGTGDGAGRRVSAGGEWYHRWAGAYGRLTTSEWGGNDTPHVFGKTVLDLGGLLRGRAGDHTLLLRGGLFVPVANDDVEALAAERSAPFSLVRDTAYHLPRVIGLRVSGSAVRRAGPLFGRLDLGLDRAHSTAAAGELPRLPDHDLVARSAVAAGILIMDLTAAVELAGATTRQEAIDPPLTGGFTVHWPLGAWQLHAGVALPLTGDRAARAAALSVGVMLREQAGSPPANRTQEGLARHDP